MKAIVNGKLILGKQILENQVLLFDDRILSIKENADGIKIDEIIDAGGCYVSPGFIDIHMHGAFGCDAMDWEEEAICTISKGICSNGVTGFLPTTMTGDSKHIQTALQNIRRAKEIASGARVLGAHLEGPFISSKRKGAHDEGFIIKAEYELIKDYLDIIRIVTIAPEVEGNMDFIKDMKRHPQVSFSIGHSDATYEEAMAAIEAGVRSATHLFNAMSGLNHRQPGVVGAALNSDIYCELIADKIHVHPAVYKLLAAVKGSDRLILITDAMRGACMKQGTYELGGQEVIVEQGAVRLPDGTLAGSVLRLNEAVRNIWENTNLSLPEVIAAVTVNPAVLIGMEQELGSLEIGKKADIIIFDEEINIKATIVGGVLKEPGGLKCAL